MPNLKDEIVQAGVEAGEQVEQLTKEFVNELGAFAVSSYATMLICTHAPGLAEDVKQILEAQVNQAPRTVQLGGLIAVTQLLNEVKKHPTDE